jgi:hypothetical protein
MKDETSGEKRRLGTERTGITQWFGLDEICIVNRRKKKSDLKKNYEPGRGTDTENRSRTDNENADIKKD